MANHVTNLISIRFSSDKRDIVNNIIETIKEKEFIHCLYENGNDSYSWYSENVGAKWARLNDEPWCDENEAEINIESAWAEVDPFVQHLCSLIGDCVIEYSFMDEMPNFGGTRKYENGELVAENHIEDMWGEIERETDRLLAEQNLSFEDEHVRNDWRWEWMWEFAYEKIELEEE
jgi:hypothetical protein